MNQNELIEHWKMGFFLPGRQNDGGTGSVVLFNARRGTAAKIIIGHRFGDRRRRAAAAITRILAKQSYRHRRLSAQCQVGNGTTQFFWITVVDVPLTDDGPMPLADGEFDLVLNRHSGFNPAEVSRILAMHGTFLTQQIHGLWAYDLLAAFDATPQWPDSVLEKYVPRLRSAGLRIVDTKDWFGELAFTNVGAIVHYLKTVPRLVPGFSVETHLNDLLNLQRKVQRGERLSFAAKKYLIEARKEVLS